MANARIVLAQGLINGTNTVFATGEPYVPGSTAYILNGRIHSKDLARGPDNDYGYVELSPDAGTIQVDNPPLIDDVVQIFFWSRKIVAPPTVTRLTGVVDEPNRVTGVVRPVVPVRITGVVRAGAASGVVRTPSVDRLAGVVQSQRIIGVVKEKC